MKKEKTLSEKKCNILTLEQLGGIGLSSSDIELADGTIYGKEIFFHHGENLIFKKGFFEEDVKQTFKKILDEIEKLGNMRLYRSKSCQLFSRRIKQTIKQKAGDLK